MRLVKQTMNKYIVALATVFCSPIFLLAQENSPLSRYGIGDLVPNQNMSSRAMGGITAGYQDHLGINISNPASFYNIGLITFDIGAEVTSRTLKSANPVQKYTANNALINYVTLGFPIATEKMRKKGIGWAMAFGLRPVSRVNYKIQENKRISGVDSAQYLYEGQGGVNQFFLGTSIGKKNFSFGVNVGAQFGTRQYESRIELINDTVEYYRGLFNSSISSSGLFLQLGTQYVIPVNKKKNSSIRLGATAVFKQNLNASQDVDKYTFGFDPIAGTLKLDSVFERKGLEGKIVLPAQYVFGATYVDNHWTVGADLELAKWSQYKSFGAADALRDVVKARLGGQYYPANDNTPVTKYWSFVKYRAGLYYGPDYVKLSNNRNEFGVTLGASLPLTSLTRRFTNDIVVLNAGVEFANRGSLKVDNLKENVTRFTIGISMNDLWFIKRKYD